jgi:regulator of sirC expression with transglutaminase-like and TPR domain
MDLESGTKDIFAEAVRRPDSQIDLFEAALALASEEYPGLPVGDYQEYVDELASALEWSLDGLDSPEHKISRLNQFFFSDLAFEGNEEDYYDPRNNFLNEVLDRRYGVPVSLSLVMIGVGRRVGLALEGVRLPLHFMVKCVEDGREILIDPFNRGRIMRREDCAELVAKLSRGRLRLKDSHLVSCGHRDILVRLLNNLKRSYLRQRDYGRCSWAIGRLLVLKPNSAPEIRDRGIISYYLGEYRQAKVDLEHYLERVPDAPDAELIEQNIARVVQRLQQMN